MNSHALSCLTDACQPLPLLPVSGSLFKTHLNNWELGVSHCYDKLSPIYAFICYVIVVISGYISLAHLCVIQTEEHQSAWCYQMLKEQVIVLETLLIYLYYKSSCEQSCLLGVVSEFKYRALTGQPHTFIKHLITDLHRPLLARLE